MDMPDGLYGGARCSGYDTVDAKYKLYQVDPGTDGQPQRSELRVKHAQQDSPEGDSLGGTLVTYTHKQGDFIHRFEEFELYEQSLLRDSLKVRQNDQLVIMDEIMVNNLDHQAVVNLFLNLKIGLEHVMVVGNYQMSSDTLRQITFSLYGFIKEEPKKEEENVKILHVENHREASMSMKTETEDEISISLTAEPHLYLYKDLSFNTTGCVEKEVSAHFKRQRSYTFVGFDVVPITTFQQKDTGFLAIDENGTVEQLPKPNPNAHFVANYNDWNTWYIKSRQNGKFLGMENGRLCSIRTDQHGLFLLNTIGSNR
ncbi:uncharacterized protein LOC132553698 isoform X2 [Ylistrum balloti]|uniref:uncharacterized protein LOC132553698 isoform X2 n=1 Tax=Ylistrum balloti TaxID=509963 RepID=UPI0029059A27|nr:uncharacterized protein LOC132553698 isoform X2 [Ylistrum balloti]